MFDWLSLSCDNLYLVFLVPTLLLVVCIFVLLEMGKLATFPRVKRGVPIEKQVLFNVDQDDPMLEKKKKLSRRINSICIFSFF